MPELPKNIPLDQIKEASVTFAEAVHKVTGERKAVCFLELDGHEEVAGMGDTRKEAMEDAYRKIYPDLKSVEMTPAVAWHPAMKDFTKPAAEVDHSTHNHVELKVDDD